MPGSRGVLILLALLVLLGIVGVVIAFGIQAEVKRQTNHVTEAAILETPRSEEATAAPPEEPSGNASATPSPSVQQPSQPEKKKPARPKAPTRKKPPLRPPGKPKRGSR